MTTDSIAPTESDAAEARFIPGPKPWTLLSNNGLVLVCLHKHPGITAREIALKVGITERAVINALDRLIRAGYIDLVDVGPAGANIYQVDRKMPMRSPYLKNEPVLSLLEAFETA